MLADQTSKATIATLQTANKHLRFAKENSDVGLQYRYVGEKNEVTFLVHFATVTRPSDVELTTLAKEASCWQCAMQMLQMKSARGTTTSLTRGLGSCPTWRGPPCQQKPKLHVKPPTP